MKKRYSSIWMGGKIERNKPSSLLRIPSSTS
jgi:hypothetical protein